LARKVFRGGLVKAVNIPAAGGDTEFRQLAAGSNDIANRLDTVFRFAVKEAESVSIKEGTKFAADNPLSLNDYINANPQQRKDMLQGDDFTAFGQAIRIGQTNSLATDMAVAAQNQFVNLKIKARTEGLDLDTFQASLDTLVNGYTAAMNDVDGEAALAVKSKLATAARTQYDSYATYLLKQHEEKQKINAQVYGQHIIDEIPDILSGGFNRQLYTNIDTDEPLEIQAFTVDQQLEMKKAQTIKELMNHNAGSEYINTWSNNWDAKVIQAKKNYLYSTAIESESDTFTEFKKRTDMFLMGDFKDNKNIKDMFESLPEDEQTAFLNMLRKERQAKVEDAKDRDNLDDLDDKKFVDDQTEKFEYALQTGDRAAALEYIKIMSEFDEEVSNQFRKDLTDSSKNRQMIPPLLKAELEDDLADGRLSLQTIRTLRNADIISVEDGIAYRKEIKAAQKAKLAGVNRNLRIVLGLPGEGDLTRYSRNAAVGVYNKNMKLVTRFILENPDYTPSQLEDYANSLVKTEDKIDIQKAQIKEIRTILFNDYNFDTDGTSRLFEKYFKEFGGPGFEPNEGHSIAVSVQTSKGIAYMIEQLEELKDMAGKDIPGSGFFGTDFMVDQLGIPNDMNKDKLQDLINELVRLKNETLVLEGLRQ
jgi:hypothetical protein